MGIQELRDEFERTATWRREKAAEHPDDTRNAEAAAVLDRLAETAVDVDARLLTAYEELIEGLMESERHSEMLREIGFHSWPSTASEFISRFIAETTGLSG